MATSAGPPLVGAVLGDRLVRPDSASGAGKSRQVPFEPARGLTLTGLHHFDLFNDPAVYETLRDWLDRPPEPTD